MVNWAWIAILINQMDAVKHIYSISNINFLYELFLYEIFNQFKLMNAPSPRSIVEDNYEDGSLMRGSRSWKMMYVD